MDLLDRASFRWDFFYKDVFYRDMFFRNLFYREIYSIRINSLEIGVIMDVTSLFDVGLCAIGGLCYSYLFYEGSPYTPPNAFEPQGRPRTGAAHVPHPRCYCSLPNDCGVRR